MSSAGRSMKSLARHGASAFERRLFDIMRRRQGPEASLAPCAGAPRRESAEPKAGTAGALESKSVERRFGSTIGSKTLGQASKASKSLSQVVVALCVSCLLVVSCGAQNAPSPNSYLWSKDASTDEEIALSLPDRPLNFLVVGDLAANSYYLIDQLFYLLADAAGLKMNRELKSYALLIIHDKNVFARLKSGDNNAFTKLGISENIVNLMRDSLTEDGTCLFETFPTDKTDDRNIAGTVVLVSAQYHTCLTQAVFRAFGVVVGSGDFDAVISVCALHEGRRVGIRERRALLDKRQEIASRCIRRQGATHDGDK